MMDLERVERKIDRFARIMEKVSNGAAKIPDLAMQAGTAFYGWKAGREAGALAGLIALKMAQANNLASGVAGTGALATLGLLNTAPDLSKFGFTTRPPQEPPTLPSGVTSTYDYWAWLKEQYEKGEFE